MKNLNQKLMIAALAVGAVQAEAAIKIGVIDMQSALRSVKRGKAAQAKFEKEVTDQRAALQKEEAALQKEGQALQAGMAAFSEKVRAEKGSAFQKKLMDFQKRGEQFPLEMQRRQGEAIAPIVKGLREVALRVGAKHKMDLVIDDTGEAVLYAEDKTDLTPELIKAYDEKNP